MSGDVRVCEGSFRLLQSDKVGSTPLNLAPLQLSTEHTRFTDQQVPRALSTRKHVHGHVSTLHTFST